MRASRRRAAIAVGVVAALVAWLLAPESADDPAATDVVDGRPARRPAPRAIPKAEPQGAEDGPPSAYVAAQAAIAEALGYVAIRCWVGPGWDVELDSWTPSRISNGWYTSVETSLSGVKDVVPAYDEAEPAREALFVVSWTATEPGVVVPCEVHTPEYAELRVRVVDDQGAPLGATITGCGRRGQSDERGSGTLERVDAGRACEVQGEHMDDAGVACMGEVSVDALASGEVRAVELVLDCFDLSDGDVLEELSTGAPPPRAPRDPPAIRRLSFAEELEGFRALRERDLGEGGSALLEELIEHRERMVPIQAERDAERARGDQETQEIRALFTAAQQADTPEEADALRAEAIHRKKAEMYELTEHFDQAP